MLTYCFVCVRFVLGDDWSERGVGAAQGFGAG